MPRVFKVRTYLGVTLELEVLEKTRDMVVLRDTETGALYKVSIRKVCDGKYILDVNGVEHLVYSSSGGVYIDFTQPLVSEILVETVSKEKESKSRSKTVQIEPGILQSPISGRVVEVRVKEGSHVNVGDTLILMESMKMIVEIKSHISGVVEELYVQPGTAVKKGDKLLKIKQL